MSNIPYKEPFPEFDDLELNTISAQECTGLIPAKVENEAQEEAYEEIFPFVSPKSNSDIYNK